MNRIEGLVRQLEFKEHLARAVLRQRDLGLGLMKWHHKMRGNPFDGMQHRHPFPKVIAGKVVVVNR